MKTKFSVLGMSFMLAGVMAGCGGENGNEQFAEATFALSEAGNELQDSSKDTLNSLPTPGESHTWEQEAVVEPGSDPTGLLATCKGWAVAPWYDGSSNRTYARGRVTCTSSTTIPAKITIVRSDGSTVGSCSFTLTGTDLTYDCYKSGCKSAISYQTQFVSNGVPHNSGWKPGCT